MIRLFIFNNCDFIFIIVPSTLLWTIQNFAGIEKYYKIGRIYSTTPSNNGKSCGIYSTNFIKY